MKRKILLTVIAALMLLGFLVSVVRNRVTEYDEYLDRSKVNQRVYIEDEFADERFKQIFFLNSIEDHSVYIVDKELCINMSFDENVTRSEIFGAKNFYSKLVYEKGMKYGALPYQSLYIQKETFDEATLRIFIDDELLIYMNYAFGSDFHDYYENMSVDLDSRNANSSNIDLFNKEMAESLPFIDGITVIKPFKPYVFLFKVTTDQFLEDNEVDALKMSIENNIALKLERDALKLYGANTNSLGIVVDLYANDDKYDELVFFNGDNKAWIEVNWLETDFFKMNLE